MTKNEFILRTVIALAGNENFSYREDDCAWLLTRQIMGEALSLLVDMEDNPIADFDEEHEPNMDKVREVLRQEFSVLSKSKKVNETVK